MDPIAHELAAVQRIAAALDSASHVLAQFTPGAIDVQYKSGSDPVTAADRAVNEAIHSLLVREGEGWFSEETLDDLKRLDFVRLWVVDPVDGTREFVQGIPEWCVSIALIENGRAIAGGIRNPATNETFLGSAATGVTYNGRPCSATRRAGLDGAEVLASRSEVKRGEWDRFRNSAFEVRPMGSVAYKMARVAAGLADATWTLVNKNEWDVAAGTALVEGAGGIVRTLEDAPVSFNTRSPLLSGLVASGPQLYAPIKSLLGLVAAPA
jgi:myo-inositol-1(or 4)-monophosphatase